MNMSWYMKISLSIIVDKHFTCLLLFYVIILLIHLPPFELTAICPFFLHLRWSFYPNTQKTETYIRQMTAHVIYRHGLERVGRNGCKFKLHSGTSKKGIFFSRGRKSLLLLGSSFPLSSPDVYVPWAEYLIYSL